MKKLCGAAIILLLFTSWVHAWTHGAGNPNLRQQNFFGLTGAAWQNPAGYYIPGTGNPAVSTSDYWHQEGVAWTRPYDLLNPDCGTAGSTIAAANGRYIWITGPDHPGGNWVFAGGAGFRYGFSNDPGVPPSRLTLFYPGWTINSAPQIATVTASISGTTLTVTAITGLLSVDNNASVTGVGVTSTSILSQITPLTGGETFGGVGRYTVDVSQSVGSESMTVSQANYFLYAEPWLVCNPDDPSFTFYVYAEGQAARVNNEEGMIKSADLITWSAPVPTHVINNFNDLSSFQRVIRDGVNSWHSTGLQIGFPQTSNVAGSGKWTSTDGLHWLPANSLFNVCIPINSPAGSITCTGTTNISVHLDAAPDSTTVSSQLYEIASYWNSASGVRQNQITGRVAIDSSFNALASPSPVAISAPYAGLYPGPTYTNGTFGYVEDGVIHYYVSVGFPTSFNVYGTVDAAPYLNGGACVPSPNVGGTCGGLWQQALDYYTEVIDPTTAANAAPVGVRASCAGGTVTLVWYDALPNRTYRVYRGTTAGSQTTLIGDVNGLSITDTPTGGSVYYYKVVTLNVGVEQKSRVVSTYASSSTVLVNAHMTRVLAAGADPTTINRTWLDTFDAWLISNGLENNLELATMADFGVAQNGSHVISKIFDFGTSRLPRGGDYTPTTTSTTYSATGINSNPAWLNGTSGAQGYYGGNFAYLNNIRRKTQITVFAAYQKPGTLQITPFGMGELSNQSMFLWHANGAPGSANFLLSDATQSKTATANFSGLATDFHTAAGVFDGTNLIAYADAVAGSSVTGLVIPSANLNPPDALTGQVLSLGSTGGAINFLGSGADGTKYNQVSGYLFDSNQALYNGGAQIMFDKALTPTQIASLNTLIRTHFGF